MTRSIRGKNARLAVITTMFAVAMIGLSFASVPLYSLFCQVTGYAGTPRIGAQAKELERAANATVTVRFNADVHRDMNWRFTPAQGPMTVRLNESRMAYFVAENLSDAPVLGTATFNITPLKAATYFNKIECFCFTEQKLAPGERVEMDVSFFVDSAIAEDPDTRDVSTITLSYTFFKVKTKDG